ncbi:MAG: hypothetical protein AABW56_02600 [Nanoarchaeota archaeon]
MNLLSKFNAYIERREFFESIKIRLGRDCKINPNITIGEALKTITNEVFSGLNNYKNLEKLEQSFENMGLYDIKDSKVIGYLEKRYRYN